MTKNEAIQQLLSLIDDAETHFTDDGDDEVFCSDVEAIEAVIAAFRQQPERESNKPLTLDELRRMDGKTWLAYRHQLKNTTEG